MEWPIIPSTVMRGVDYVEEECSNSVGARSILCKNSLDQIEAKSPGTRHNFPSTFFFRIRQVMENALEEFEIRGCQICGQATTSEVCAFCRMWQQAREKAQGTPHRAKIDRHMVFVYYLRTSQIVTPIGIFKPQPVADLTG